MLNGHTTGLTAFLFLFLASSSSGTAWSEDPPLMPGWPKEMGSTDLDLSDGIAFADVDGDGDQEVLAGTPLGRFWIWDHEGIALPGWPVSVPGTSGISTIGDLDNDGDLEILFTAPGSGMVYIYHHDGTPFAGWPQQTRSMWPPSFYDLDDDGIPEVIWATLDGLEVRYAGGTDFPGFPVENIGIAGGSVAIGDFVNDLTGPSSPDILFRSYVDFSRTQLYAIRSDGTIAEGWPVTIEHSSYFAAPSLADIDGNGTLDVLNMSYTRSDQVIEISAFNGSGIPLDGFPVAHLGFDTGSSVVPADIDQDGDLELIYSAKSIDGDVFARDHHGNLLPGFPQRNIGNLQSSPIVGNLDTSTNLEISVATSGNLGEVYAYTDNGSVAFGFPFDAEHGAGGASPAIGDIDGDGDVELGTTNVFGRVSIWDLDIPWDPDGAAWPTFLHDNWNTSQYGFRIPDEVAAVPGPTTIDGNWVELAFPNPFLESTRIYLRSPAAESAHVDVFDLFGRRVRSWTSIVAPGDAILWDGKDQSGRELPSGAYVIRIESGGREAVQRITRIR